MSLASQLDDFRNDPVRVRRLVAALAATLVVIIAFRDPIANLFERWNAQEELSHSYFIPLISAWLVWANRDAVQRSVGEPSLLGIGLALFSGFLLVAGQLLHALVFSQIGLVFAVAALVAGFGGRSLLTICAIPIIYLFFAVPPPFWVITTLSWNFQMISSQLGVAAIKLLDIPVFLSGNVIDLGTYKLAVAEACSGLRYLFPFLSLGFLAAYLFKAPLWQRAIVFLSTIPITILMNSFRIAVTGILVNYYGLSHTEGFLHLFEGWVVFLLCLAALVAVIALFCSVVPPRRHVLDALGVPDLVPVPPTKGFRISDWPKVAALGLISLVFIGATIASTFATVDTLIEPPRESYAFLPAEFENFDYKIKPIDSEIAEVLGADDSLVVDFQSPDGQTFNLYTAYLTARRDGRSWHSPRQCIPGGGWQVTDLSVVTPGTGPDPLDFPYNRMVIEYAGHRQLVYYWYDQRGKKFADEYTMKLSVVYDTLTKRRADGALVRLMTPIPQDQTIAEAEARLKNMARRLNEVMPKYVPA